MVKRFLKRILVFSSVACLVLACVPTLSFAVDPVSGAMALAGAMDAYGMAYGVGTVYDVSSSSGVTSSFEGLWDDFSSYQSNAGSQFDYDSFMDDYNQNRSLYGFEHSSGKFAAWYIDSESAEVFDQFWNWLLTGPAEMTRVDNEYFHFSQNQIGSEASPISVYGANSALPITQVSSLSNSYASVTSGTLLCIEDLTTRYNSWYSSCVSSSSDPVYCYAYIISNNVGFYFFSESPFDFSVANTRSTNQTNIYNYNTHSAVLDNDLGLYIFSGLTLVPIPTGNDRTFVVPVIYPSLADAKAASSNLISGNVDSIGVKANDYTGIVTLPNPYGQDYVPTPLEIVTNIPWDSSYDDTDEENGQPVPFPPLDVPLVVDDIISAISAEDYSIEEDPQDPDPDPPPPAPSEVFVPLLPVGLPSFNFSFSGIWHYVREWVASLGAWFTTLFTIWGALPYAMVVPVYATAVVVIVLGVYKRFFM